MSHKKAFKALHRSVQDLPNNNISIDGVTMVLWGEGGGGNFRQTLPIIPQGTRADKVKRRRKQGGGGFSFPKFITGGSWAL